MDFVKGSHKNPILPHNDDADPNNLLTRGQDRLGNFIHLDPTEADFSSQSLASYDRVRTVQSEIVMSGFSGKGMYGDSEWIM